MNVDRFMKGAVHALYAALAFFAFGAVAQTVTPAKLLLPITPGHVQGGYGSEWLTELMITNMGNTEIVLTTVTPVVCFPFLPCLTFFVSARSTVLLEEEYVLKSDSVRGAFLLLQQGDLSDLAVTLRSRDLSRQGETWGTVIPVVSKDDLFSRRFGLLDVPIEPQFRAMLRVYDFDAETPANVRVRVYALNPRHPDEQMPDSDTLLLDVTPAFNVPSFLKLSPASFELPLWLEPALANAGRVRIQIDPLDQTGDYWAFVSVTHNDTQHVTVITPQ